MNNNGKKVKELESFFDAFYTRFVLRDFFGKITPGVIVLITFTFTFVELNDALWIYNYITNLWIWICFIAFSWLVGFSLQGIGLYFKLVLIYPKEINKNIREDRYNKFRDKATSRQYRHNERYVVIKEACGNGSVALISSLVLILANGVFKLGLKNSILNLYLENNGLNYFIPLVVIMILIIIFLNYMHHSLVNLQWDYMCRVLNIGEKNKNKEEK